MSTQKITLPYIESSKEDSIMEKKLRDSKDSALIVKYRSRKNLKFHWPVNRQNENIFKRVHIEPLPLLKNHQKVNSPEYLKNMKRKPLELRNAIDPTYRKKRAKGSIIRDDFVTRQLVDDVSVQNAWAEKVQNTIRDDNNSKYYGLKNMLVVVDIVRNFKNDTFLYLVPTCSHSNVKYDYYNLKVVSYDKIDKNNYCTISKHGVCRMRKDDETEFIKLDRWEIEILSFNSLIKIKLFKHFRMWKAYTVWKINVRHKNTREAAKYLEENLFILKDSLRPAILNVREMCYRMSDMSMCQFDELKTYDLDSFIETQCKQISAVGERLNEFHDLVKEVIRSACRTALLEEGFTPDDYFYDTIENSEAYRSATASSSYIMQSNYDMDLYAEAPDKMTYTEQSKKRSHCRRLTSFIRLIDYLIVTTLHVLSVNSISIILSQLTHHVENSPKKEEIAEWIEKNEDDTDMCGPVLSEVERNTPESSNTPNEENKINPLFIISLNMDKQGQITFNPSESTFHSQMDSLIKKYKEAVLKLKNLVADTFFDSFTRPIINNKFEEKTCGDGPCLPFMFDDDVKLNNICTNIHNSIGAAFTAGYYYSSTFQPIAKFFSENEQKDLNLIKKQDHNIDFFSESLNIYYKQHKLANMIVPYKNLGLMLIDSVEAKKKIIPSPLRCISVIDELLPEKAKKDVEILNSELQDAEFRLEQQPITTIDYVDSLNFLDDIQKRIEPLQKESHIIDDMYNLINFYKVPKRDVDYAVYKTLSGSINKVLGLIDKSLAERDQNLDCFCTKIEKDILELTHEVKKVKSEIHNPLLLDINSERKTISTSLNTIQEQIEEFQERAFTYKSYQKNFQVELTTYEELEEVDAELKLKQLLWSSLDEWNKTWEEWISVPLKSLDPENLTEITKKFQKTIYQLEKGLPPNSVVPHLKGLVENMRDKLTTIANLVNPALRDRHIESIETVLEYNFTEEDPMTLSKLIDIDAFDLSESINEISGQASSEASLEMLLKKVKNSWKTCEFNVLPFRDTKDVYILGGVDDIQMILENSNIAISTIASSRHVGPIKHEVDDWILQLDLFSHTVDEWLICQRNWLYLESIFSAPDIQRQLPAESKMFITVDKSYKLIMKKLNKMPLALRSGTQPGLLNTLQNNNMLLDQILKCLEAYLESKRMIFSRFYFLSNDELLEILAQTRNPMAVQPHLRKCFDAISKLEFGVLPKSTPLNVDGLTTDFNKSVDDFDATSSNVGHSDDADVIAYSNDILAMISPEGERVPMTKGLKARGNVEEWLCKVEDSMFASLRKLTISSLADYEKKPRLEWVKGHAAQVVLTVSQIIWANNIMNILTNKNKDQCQNSLINFEQSSYKDLNDLASMVRTKLDKILRIIICALITIDVHARDIVTELKNQNVSSVESFEWQKQLKYYWDININNCIIRMSNSTYTYGYEYLGASSRLVITALTDRCYLCLMGALQLNLGGAPAGPAGTGKTESTKDLSKALGKQCVVFNCSDGIDYQMMGRFFSGLAQSGAWCCFDEFNRIYIEVLSVIAQQLITIRNAKANKLSVFMFEGREIKLHPDCAAFITMNPGYAGRTELPDNLKALFRPISMMVPDYKQIAEVILYSEGFESSKKLAQKMAQMYQLCSEQLSQQDHYDFGMRAVKSVLVMAGSLKRQHTNKPEDVVLITALKDANIPKFLKDDVVLFKAILQDLFPSVEIPAYDYGSVKAEIESVILNKNMQLVPNQVTKVIELYETMIVRHGVMLVGPTGSGKTVIYQTLAEICQNLSTSNTDMQNPFFVPVHKFVLNPKSITLGELFGQYNPLTLEWSDGLMGLLVRAAVRHTNSDHQWIICDGPVDAVWIENMNTVLDDNKMLCLANSERIKLTEFIHMIFEVQDLKAASPATVSRCGMVYCDANGLKWNSLVGSWIDVNLTKLDPEMKQFLIGLFNDYVEDGLQYARNKCIQIIDQVDIAKVVTLMKLLDGLLIENMDKLNLVPKNKKAKNIISTIFVFCYIWSIGGNLIDLYRDPFDTFVRHKFEDCPEAKLPTSAELWSYYYDVENKRMESWERSVPHFIYKQNVPFFEILVPTCDTVRYRYFMKMLLSIKKSVMFIGPSGVGKSVIVRKLLESMKDDSTIPVFINFSAQTTSQRTQEMIETKLIKKGTNMYGAPDNKEMVIFVDDLNMPKLDDYGSQPPIELLRQFQDFRGFYDRFGLFWKNIHEDVTLCAACGPPGGGRNAITPRFVRHFSVFSLSPPSEYSLKHIFSVILTGFFDEFNMEIKQVVDNMLNVAVEMYIRMSVDLLPTPDKSHYIFNLRDLSKCVQGLTRADKNIIKTQKDVVELFTHESLRVFHDRLVNIEDKRYFYKMMSELISKNLNETIPPEDFETDPIIFGDYGKINANMDDRIYEKIDIDKIAGILMDYLQEYNLAGQKEMKLVFFRDAIEHVSRIVRIIRQTRGNAVLVGVGGTGKKSLTALASFICNYTFFQIELTRGYDSKSFHEDLQKLYMLTAVKNKNTVFMFTDSNIISEDFLEDVNNILNSGEVPNLFDAEEYEKLIIGCRPDAKEAGISEGNREAIYNFAISRVRNNLHIVLCMSPVGRAFRNRCIMFPSLVNCCTIDWFTVWPKEALLNVSNSLLSQLDIGSNEIMDKLSKICAEIHLGVGEIAERFYLELKRRYYTTPTSYLELLTMYIGMVSEKKTQLTNSLNRISSGLKKLKETNELVDTMKGEMVLLKPELEKKSKNTEELMEKLIIDQDKADAVRKIVAHDKANAAEKSKETQTIAEDAQRDLNEALPALESAVKALDSLDKNDISEIRVFQKPPELVQTVMEAVCLLLNAKQDWASAKNVLGESNFLRRLYDYDKDSIPESILKKLKKYIDNPKFTPEAVDRVSKAAKSLCMWVRAIDLYAHVFRTVEPKRKRLAEAEKENKIVQDALMVQQQKLSDVEDEITKLQQTYEDSVAEKHSLEKNMSLTQARIKRSGKLTMALADENEHWKCSIASIEIEIANVVGNVFLSAACIAYYGAFTSSYRELLATSWAERLKELEIPISDEASLISVMGTPFQIRQWNIEGLPRDRLSTENAIIVTRSRRWPLMIDPQEQAYRWIKSRENVNSIKIIKMTDSSFLSTIENCIRVGIPVLIEDIGETIDPAIEPILAKQTYVEGGRMLIRLGDSDIDYDMNFRLYITTKMPNPHYMPDVCILVTIINFTVTQDGLEDQLLSDVVRLERPDLEEQKNELIIKINNDKNQLKAIEDRILKLLFESEGNILDNEELIDTLNDSKITSDQISIRLEETEQTEKKIQYARDKYRPVAIRGSIMYFIVADLAQIDKMYQFSLKYFKSLFNGTIENSEKNKNLKLRLDIILTNTTWDVYRNVSRGLFEDDKVTFSFLLCTAIMKIEKEISDLEWHIYLHGVPESKEVKIENPFNENIPNNLWQNMVYLNKNLLMFKNIHLSILMKNIAITLGNKTTIVNSFLKDIDLSGNDNILEIINKDKSEIMFDFDESLSLFQKLLLIRCLDKKYVVGGSVELVKLRIGSQFIESPPSNMQTLYQDLNKIRPLIFILSPGSDPMSGLMRFAKDMSYEHRVHAISLGQGQGPIAEKIINSSAENGDWVYLQNCHLAASWMISMENLIKNQSENPENINEDFRLFLSSMPSPCFPISVLQNGAKVTNEPPKGIKANMRKAFNELTVAFFEENALGLPWRKIISSICFFHSVILERKKFGPIGWNIKYEFNDSDRETALLNFEMFCGDSIKWDALTYITGEITYGGRVTDYWDQRCLTTILTNFFNKNCIKSDYKFSKSGIYYAPNVATINENIDYIENLPITDDPEIFSMHDNANIIYQIQEANRLLNAIISLSPQIGSSVTGQSNEEIVYSKCESFQERIPQLINKETIRPEYFNTDAKDRISSITTVLLQETDRYNNLLSLIHKTLADLKKAIKGLLVMDTKLYDIFMSFINNKLPKLWADNAYPSMMNLNTWVFDLMMRCNFIQNWIDVTIPKSFWISGFFYPQGFLTALLQNYGRKYSYPIDHLSFHYKILKIYRNHRDVYESSLTLKYGDTLPMDEQIEVPNDGVLIHGLFMDGFRWNNKKGRVEDCLMGEIISSLPIVHMEPRMDYKPVKNVYRAPLYKTSARYGVLTTTGHSSNFVVVINLPTNHSSDYWILKGAALLCQKE